MPKGVLCSLVTENVLALYKEKIEKMSIKSVKMKFSKNKKCVSFPCPKVLSTQISHS